MQSINLSGHKYGLVYPGIGWLLFKDAAVVPDDLVFDVNYLGGNMPTYTLNFSRGSAMIVAQYYNFLRLGRSGYEKIVKNMMQVSDVILKGLLETGVFDLVGTRRMEPVVSVTLEQDKTHAYTVYEISEHLRTYGWIVPAYTLPENAEEMAVLRIVVKENMSMTLAESFLSAVRKTLEILGKNQKRSQARVRQGKFMPH